MKYRVGKRFLSFVLALAAVTVLWGTSCSQVQAEEIQQAQTSQNNRKYVIVLDPGHGGNDIGANRVFDNVYYEEREINLALATYCKEELEKNPNITVYLTRYDNTSPLMNRQQRIQVAQNVHADALISLHINSTSEAVQYTESGASVYYPNANYNKLMSDVGLQMSNHILHELEAMGVRNNGALIRNATDGSTYPDGTLSDYLGINYFSKLCGIPGILVEHAYVNNPNDCLNYFRTWDLIRQLAVADARGIMNAINSGVLDYQKQGHWEKDNVGWRYAYAEGGYATNKWELVNGRWYYFDSRGYMTYGWQYINGRWYYLSDANDGSMKSGWQYINGRWYYLGAADDGSMKFGWQYINGRWYYLSDANDGSMKSGWQYINGRWYYLGDANDGSMKSGWQYINGRWYYLGDANDGSMKWDWQRINGSWYYLGAADDGAMAANTWIGRYYVNGSGVWTATR